jgi:hypothetical protein
VRGVRKDQGVVDDARILGPELHGADPGVSGKVKRQDKAARDVHALGGNPKGPWHADDQVRFPQAPTVGELREGGQIGGAALWSALCRPVPKRSDLRLRQETGIGKVSKARFSSPRGHKPAPGDLGDLAGTPAGI